MSHNRPGRPRLTKARILNDREVEYLWGDKALELDEKAVKEANKPKGGHKAIINENNNDDNNAGDGTDAYDTAEEKLCSVNQ
ncbi:hypothetical protein Dda_6937 [Drechslerella dactyloides]|uniref:Uncharacterized protein n=1 Tax=Drechslerella dactyloides TaxID=74499 RepID=A0AAD6NH09_DREDA|nr:hypothetical protein Dda_6937 [Drechslerella dactyloides]